MTSKFWIQLADQFFWIFRYVLIIFILGAVGFFGQHRQTVNWLVGFILLAYLIYIYQSALIKGQKFKAKHIFKFSAFLLTRTVFYLLLSCLLIALVIMIAIFANQNPSLQPNSWWRLAVPVIGGLLIFLSLKYLQGGYRLSLLVTVSAAMIMFALISLYPYLGVFF